MLEYLHINKKKQLKMNSNGHKLLRLKLCKNTQLKLKDFMKKKFKT